MNGRCGECVVCVRECGVGCVHIVKTWYMCLCSLCVCKLSVSLF